MRSKKLLWRIYLAFCTGTLLAFLAIAWYVTIAFNQFYQQQTGHDLLIRARLVAQEIAGHPPETGAPTIDLFCKDFGRLTQTRVTIMAPDGRVLGDTEEDPANMENHATRPEVAAAMRGNTGKSMRFSATRQKTLMYIALPVYRGGKLTAVARTALPLASMTRPLHAVYKHMLLGAAGITVIYVILALFFFRHITRPLEQMRAAAERLARGDLSARVPESNCAETAALARTLNQMAVQLGERMRITTEQHNEQEIVLVNMLEGVLAVDKDERILHLNPAAAQLFEVQREQARGCTMQETIRNPDLQKFVSNTLAQSGVLEGELVLYGKEDRFLQLHGTVLKDTAGTNFGALVVFTDVTRLKRLETIRRDFVANASHELKTPITALKGCIETCQFLFPAAAAGADPAGPQKDAQRFIAMMARHAERLEAIVNDLLSLSKIDFAAEQGKIQLNEESLNAILRRAANNFKEQAEYKKIFLAVDCPDELTAAVNAPLLEQAVGNLIDNAVKYSAEGTSVKIRAELNGHEIEISVADRGIGIEKKHLDRIFERFYRVDQARSRALGGTGLGLSIVKHTALAHHGTVGVTSVPGQGSVFTIRFPR